MKNIDPLHFGVFDLHQYESEEVDSEMADQIIDLWESGVMVFMY